MLKFYPCNISTKLEFLKRAKQNYLVSFQIVEEVPRLIYGSCENLRKFQKSIKEKAFKIAHPILNSNISKTLKTPKQKWWSMLTCYYKPPLTIFWQALVKENKCHILLIIWKFQKFQKLKNSNKLLLETFFNWSKTLTSAFLC